MSEENTLVEGAGESLPAEQEVVSQEAPQDGGEQVVQAQPEKSAQDEQEQRKKNRTTEYINRIKQERNELQRRLAEYEAAKKPAESASAPQDEPRPEQFNYDVEAYTRAHHQWSIDRARQEIEAAAKQAEAARRNAEVSISYKQRVDDFVQQHPDFEEVVNTIPYDLPSDVIAAIMAHERGPEIAYHLGSNDDDAFQMAMVRPEMAAAAVKRIASRLTATQKAPETPSKPLSKAPPPPPMVSGRSPTETPPEKMTDDQWYRARKAGK
jgi:hypothetical protein